ncbi:MAG: hypothetical protein U0326_02495 [Polyangiales bacterium]
MRWSRSARIAAGGACEITRSYQRVASSTEAARSFIRNALKAIWSDGAVSYAAPKSRAASAKSLRSAAAIASA